MASRVLPTAALAALAALLLAGCGSSVGASVPAPPPTLPPAPPLAAEAARALAEPAPPIPPAPAGQPAVQSGTLLSVGFDDSVLDGWTAEDFSEGPASPASWVAREGALVQDGDAIGLPDPGGTSLVAGEDSWADYSVSAYLFAAQPTSLGLIARKSAEGYYRARVDATAEGGQLTLELVVNGQVRELARAALPAPNVGRWVRLELDLRGATIRATLDDALSVQASDSTLDRGRAGLYATAEALARFDNLLVAE
jgi:hypothetical protein